MKQPLQTRRVKEALARVRSLFMDPDTKLTTATAAQMAGLDSLVCGKLLRSLVDAGFLEQRLQGVFVRSPSEVTLTDTVSFERSIIMSGSLHPTETIDASTAKRSATSCARSWRWRRRPAAPRSKRKY